MLISDAVSIANYCILRFLFPVRGESMVLKSKIEVDMPCLTAEFVKRGTDDFNTIATDGGPLLVGQISPWTIRLRNVGNAPASSTTLKTNLPWINVLSSENNILTVEEQEAQATSRCLGPTGTLISLQLVGEHLKENGKIHPGEHVDIPIQMRTSGSGKEAFYMLFRYELWDPMGKSKRQRWLRQMYEVPVSQMNLMTYAHLSYIISLPVFPSITILLLHRYIPLSISAPRLRHRSGKEASKSFQ